MDTQTPRLLETKVINGKTRRIYMANDEIQAFRFARVFVGTYFQFFPDSYKIVI